MTGKLAGREVGGDGVERLFEGLLVGHLPRHEEGQGVLDPRVIGDVDQPFIDDLGPGFGRDIGAQVAGRITDGVDIGRRPRHAGGVDQGRAAAIEDGHGVAFSARGHAGVKIRFFLGGFREFALGPAIEHGDDRTDDFQVTQLLRGDVHQHIATAAVLVGEPLSEVAHGGGELTLGTAELFEHQGGESGIGFGDPNRISAESAAGVLAGAPQLEMLLHQHGQAFVDPPRHAHLLLQGGREGVVGRRIAAALSQNDQGPIGGRLEVLEGVVGEGVLQDFVLGEAVADGRQVAAERERSVLKAGRLLVEALQQGLQSQDLSLGFKTVGLQPAHVEHGQGVLGPAFRDIGMGRILPVDDIDGAVAEHPQPPVLDHHSRVFVDAQPHEPRIVGHRAQQPAEPSPFGEMLVDDDIGEQAQSGSHVHLADPVGLRARSLDQHGLAHHRSPRRRACDQAPARMEIANAPLDRRVADLAGEPELVAAAEEDARGAVEPVEKVLLMAFGAVLDVELDQFPDAEALEAFPITVEIAFGFMGGDGRDHQLAAAEAPGDLAEDDPLAGLDDAGRVQAQGRGREGRTEGQDLRPHRFDTGRRQDDEVPGSRRFKACSHGLLLLLHAAETRRVRAAAQRAFGEEADHVPGGTNAVVGRLPEDDFVEEACADLAHGDDLLRPPVAGDADHGDGPSPGGPDRRHEGAEGPKAVRVVGVVHDDPETVLVADVEATGILLVAGCEAAQGRPDPLRKHAYAVAGRRSRQGVGHIEGGRPAQGRRQVRCMAQPAALAPVVKLEHAAYGVIEDRGTAFGHMLQQEARGVGTAAHGEIDDPAARPPTGHGLGHHRLDLRQVLQRVHPLEPQVVGLDVEDAADVATVEGKALAEDAPPGAFQHGDVDDGIIEHPPGAARAAGVAGADPLPVDIDAAGVGQAHDPSFRLQHMGDHPPHGRFPVGARHCDHGNAGPDAPREHHVQNRPGDVPRLALRRRQMHAQSRRRIDLDHTPAGVAHRAADVRRQKIHPGHVQAQGQGGPPGDSGVGRMNLVGPVRRGPARGKVGGGPERDPDAGPRNALGRQALAGQEGQRLLVEADLGQAVLMADAPARVGVDRLDQLGHRPAAVPLDAGRAALGDSDDPAVDHQNPVIAARKLLLDDDPSSVGRRQGEGLPDGLARVQACRHAPSMVAVERLDHNAAAQACGGGGGLVRGAHHLPARGRTAHGLKQGLGLGLVARQFGRDQARAVRHA
uniref:PE-PGRS family protein n=1 Tax=Parastrongyloides trichosuri TaxID=131310 RepID=A0A0N4ZWI7_PARTI